MSLRERFGASQLTEHESKQLLREYDIPVLEEELAETAGEAEEIAERIGFPVILKVESRDVQHKTEAGGVQKVESADQVADAFEQIRENIHDYDEDADFGGILVGEVLDGNEFIVGVNQDPQFGSVLMFGLGGIYVEVFRDVAFRVIPVDDYDVKTMFEDLDSEPLLDGVRGQPPADRDKLTDVLQRVSHMVEEEPEIRELDINPLFIDGDEIKAADALITLGDRQ
ncbi:MAG: acetate--CoA ligase family protein [Candidatus Nanohaloarchaea archaeon]|nr:acetate--CoA ligase family protein [Candidatus Nanohaloarchaea archaeon]